MLLNLMLPACIHVLPSPFVDHEKSKGNAFEIPNTLKSIKILLTAMTMKERY